MPPGRPKTVPPVRTNRVFELRRERGWSLEKVAELSGLSNGQVQRIETGRRPMSQKSLLALAKGFGVPARELLPLAPAAAPGASPSLAARLDRLLRELRPDQIEGWVALMEQMLPTDERRAG